MDISIVVAIVLIALVALFFIVRASSGSKPVTQERPVAIEPQREDIADSAVAAVEDVVGPLVGIDIHPDIPDGPADELTVLKGLGPKAAAQLNALGITRYAQIAAWSEADIAAIDARMGAFKGRIARDKWVEQAGYLAAEDKSGFEAKFGKLGS